MASLFQINHYSLHTLIVFASKADKVTTQVKAVISARSKPMSHLLDKLRFLKLVKPHFQMGMVLQLTKTEPGNRVIVNAGSMTR